MRDAAGELDHFETALNIAFGIGNGLAVLGRQQFCQLVELVLHEIDEFHQHAGAALRVGRRPGRKGRLRHRNGMLDFGMLGERDLGLHLAGIGVEHVSEPPRCALHGLAADEMPDLAHLGPPLLAAASVFS